MDHIPIEILHLIFIQLTLKDKLQCMLVCQFWYNTLDQRSLLHTLHISDDQFQRFKDMVERLPYRGTQVEKLIVQLDPAFDKRKLCNMFPNLREVYLINDSIDGIQDQSYLNTKFGFIYPTTNLEIIEDFGHCELIRGLAISNSCTHVNFLHLNFSYCPESTVTNVFSQLKNMPVLETLYLSTVAIKLTDLEILHSNLGSIKYLELYELDLCSGEIPRNVTPATLITKLEYSIVYAADLHTHIEFYKYIHKKYPSVSRPDGHDIVIGTENEDYVKEIYTKGIIPLYQDIGSQIDTFCFDPYCNGLDAFKKFDEYGFKLKNLQIKAPGSIDDDDFFLEQLAQSDQSKYIESLHLENKVPLPLIELKRMKALHTLGIYFYHWRFRDQYQYTETIDFSEFLKACPATLSNLFVNGVGFIFSDSPLNPTFINCLELAYIDLTRDLAKIIETHFPKLSTLTLMGDLKNNLEISLPDHNLERAIISVHWVVGAQQGFRIKTTNDDKVQYYAQRETLGGTKSRDDQAIPVTKEEFDASLVLNFTCASVKELILTLF
jgi:hypothetical protein